MEEFLRRLMPGFDEQCSGATLDEIGQLEQIAGRPLPAFYQWFLTQMGRDMGPLASGVTDFSAGAVLAAYKQNAVSPDPRRLLIGFDHDEVEPLLFFYDLDMPMQDDALVMSGTVDGDTDPYYETFRALLADSAQTNHRIANCVQRCRGGFHDEDDEVPAKLDRTLNHLGFWSPVLTGPSCMVRERDELALSCIGTPRKSRTGFMAFDLGGSSEGSLRNLLGEIGTKAGLKVVIDHWYEPGA